jgi:myo-inositol 2-dehydrogenase / D-chiro-inositol 1-dehydrogenase
MRVAVLGAGRIGGLHSRLLSEHPDVDEVVVADERPDRAEEVAASVSGRAAAIGDAIDAADATVITAATSAHVELIGASLDAGKPCFCEKPIALDLGETAAVVERVEGEDAVLQIGFQRRFDPGYSEARRLVASGEIGTLFTVRLATHDPDPPHEEYIEHAGGIFRDLHIHDLDSLRWVTGREAAQVYAVGVVREYEWFKRYGDFDTAAALVTMEDGVLAVLTGGRRDRWGYDVRAELVGSQDSVAVGLDEHTPMRSLEPGAEKLLREPYHANFAERFEPAYRAELSHFLDLARGRADNPCTARDALEALRLAVAADDSVERGGPVALPELP